MYGDQYTCVDELSSLQTSLLESQEQFHLADTARHELERVRERVEGRIVGLEESLNKSLLTQKQQDQEKLELTRSLSLFLFLLHAYVSTMLLMRYVYVGGTQVVRGHGGAQAEVRTRRQGTSSKRYRAISLFI